MTTKRDEVVSLLQPGEVLEITLWKNEQDEEGSTFQAVIRDVVGDAYLLVPSVFNYEKHAPLLSPPVLVGALYGDGPVPYVFYPTLRSLENAGKSNYKGFWLSMPLNMEVESIQRRAFVRINAQVPVKIESDLDVPAYTIDISGGGLQFASAKSYCPGTVLYLHIQFQPNNPPVCVKAKTVQSRENMRAQKKEEDAVATSCQFVDVSEATQQRLMGECFRIELYQKKHLQS